MSQRSVGALLSAGFCLWLALLVVVSWYYPTGGDEPGYIYSITQILKGRVPVLDFLAIQPPAFFIPYAIIAKALSPSLEAMRLMSVSCMAATALMVAMLASRAWGRGAGVIAFIMVGASHFWLYWNIQVIHYPIANTAFLAAFFVVHRYGAGVGVVLAAGFLAGWGANSRLILGPVAVVVFLLAVARRREQRGTGRVRAILAVVGPFTLGGLLATLPLLALFAIDPHETIFNLLGARLESEIETRWTDAAGGWMDSAWRFLHYRLHSTSQFFLRIDLTSKATVGNLIVPVAAMLALISAMAAGRQAMAAWMRAVRNDSLIVGAAAMAAGVVLIHYVTILSAFHYIQACFPFLVLASIGVLHHAAGPFSRRSRAWMALVLCLIPYGLYDLYWMGSVVLRRNEPSDGRPITAASVACWLERAIPGTQWVMSFGALPAALSRRDMPPGYEYNNSVAWYFWDRSMPAETHRFPVLTPEKLRQVMEDGRLKVIVNDAKQDLLPGDWFSPLLRSRYRLVWTTGGAWPYDIWLHADAPAAWHAPAPAPRLEGRFTLARAANADTATRLAALGQDALDSAASLPGDLRQSWRRLTDAPIADRCPVP